MPENTTEEVKTLRKLGRKSWSGLRKAGATVIDTDLRDMGHLVRDVTVKAGSATVRPVSGLKEKRQERVLAKADKIRREQRVAKSKAS